jgi:parallel beta-helix repeat protein
MNIYRRTLAISSALAISAATLVVGAGPASAAHVSCGQTITTNTTFDSNVGPCLAGLTVGADNITIDLNGFTLSGDPVAVGEGPGVDITGRTGVTVRNGTISNFDAGVGITGGSNNTVTYMTLTDNRGTTNTDFGDGVAIFNSTGNTVSFNQIRNNGPYSGISLIRSSNNVVEHNQIVGNNQAANNTSGIRVENVGNAGSNANTIRYNLVQGSGLDGIQIFSRSNDNMVNNNTVLQSGRDGINVFAGANRNTIQDNQVRFNGFGPIPGSGIFVRGAAGTQPAPANNIIRRNSASGNFQFDLRDGTPNCGTNLWSANQGFTGTPPCVFNP